MLQNVCTIGINSCGSDVPGFLGEVPDELFVRWYQAATFFPFMRGHADRTTKRREPWLLPMKLRTKVAQAIIKRYQLIPYIYTMFYFCNSRSWPFVMPVWMKYKDPILYDIECQYLFGTSFLISPIISDENEVKVYLPLDEVWYSFNTGERAKSGENTYKNVELETIPAYIKGGSVIPLYVFSTIFSTKDLKKAPIALLIALKDNEAKGYMYMDDGETFNYSSGEYAIFVYQFKNNKLVVTFIHDKYKAQNYYSKVSIIGMEKRPSGVTVTGKDKAIDRMDYNEKIGRVDITFYENTIPLMEKLELSINN